MRRIGRRQDRREVGDWDLNRSRGISINAEAEDRLQQASRRPDTEPAHVLGQEIVTNDAAIVGGLKLLVAWWGLIIGVVRSNVSAVLPSRGSRHF
jgi:hypothetical protein